VCTDIECAFQVAPTIVRVTRAYMTQIRCEEIKLEEHRKTKNYETHSYVLFLSSLSMRTQYVRRD